MLRPSDDQRFVIFTPDSIATETEVPSMKGHSPTAFLAMSAQAFLFVFCPQRGVRLPCCHQGTSERYSMSSRFSCPRCFPALRLSSSFRRDLAVNGHCSVQFSEGSETGERQCITAPGRSKTIDRMALDSSCDTRVISINSQESSAAARDDEGIHVSGTRGRVKSQTSALIH